MTLRADEQDFRGKGHAIDLALTHPAKHDPRIEGELRLHLRRKYAVVLAVGLLPFAVSAALIFLYWEYARPFVATDDPFLAALGVVVSGDPISSPMAAPKSRATA